MTYENKVIYEKTVQRLARAGVKDPTAQIVFLAEEIERYRSKIRSLEDYIKGLTDSQPKPNKMTYAEARKDIIESGINLGAGDFVSVEALQVAAAALEYLEHTESGLLAED